MMRKVDYFHTTLHKQRNWYIQHSFLLYIVFALPVFYLVSKVIVVHLQYTNTDFFKLWLSGYLAKEGKNPYVASIWLAGHSQFGSTWLPEKAFIYPQPISLFFIPFGALPLFKAFVLWDTLSLSLIVISVVLLMNLFTDTRNKYYIFPILAGIAIFRPTIITLVNGQLSAFLLATITFVIVSWEKERWWQGCVFLSLLTLKPNLGVPIILIMMFYLVLKKKTKWIIVFAVSCFSIFLVGCFQNPNWVVDYWRVGNNKLFQVFGLSPTVWGITNYFCHQNQQCVIYGGLSFCLILIIGMVFLFLRSKKDLSPKMAASLAITLTLMLTPYTWPYDQLLLVLPVITITLELANIGYRFISTSLVMIFLDIISFIGLYLGLSHRTEIWSILAPLFIFILLIWLFLKINSKKIKMDSVI